MNFSADYQMKISTWAKKLPELVRDDNYKWIGKYHKQIFEYIMKNYENKNTLKGHFSVLAGILKALDTQPRAQKNIPNYQLNYVWNYKMKAKISNCHKSENKILLLLMTL